MSFLARERYIDPEFAALEHERLWPRVWQVACRIEDIPRVGDFAEYVIGDQSVLVVRVGDDDIAAYLNACRHRATELAKGSGSFERGQIVCPFHGWRWHLDGSAAATLGKQTFAAQLVTPDELCLRSCRVALWGGCVWVTFDDDARPLEAQLAPMTELLDPLCVGKMRVRWWKHTVLAANWKMAQEAFMEGWHVRQTHPQLEGEGANPESLAYSVHANGHSHFQNAPRASTSELEDIIASSRRLWTGLDAMTLEREVRVFESLRGRPLPEGGSYGSMFVAALYEQAGQDGIALPAPERDVLGRWGGMFFLFPNYFVLPQYGNALIYRSRPNGADPESCIFELWSVTLPAAGETPPRPRLEGPFRPDDADAWPEIPLQDFSNIERQQRGLHSRSITGIRLSDVYERGIANMHAELDRYLSMQ